MKQKQWLQKTKKDELTKKQLKQVIHQWLQQQQKEFQHKQESISNSQISSNKYLRIYSSSHPHSSHITQRICKIISLLYSSHPIFSRINYYLAQTLINIGTFKLYSYDKQILNVFYSQKNYVKYSNKIGIILYGKLKLYNKVQKYVNFIDDNDTIGEHNIENIVGSEGKNYINVKVKAIDQQQTAILWIKKQHYQHLFKQSMKSGLKEQIKKLQSHIRISWLRKKIKINLVQ